jgi:hypothetical protein
MQIFFVIFIVAAAVAAIVHHLLGTLRQTRDCCSGKSKNSANCSHCTGCALHGVCNGRHQSPQKKSQSQGRRRTGQKSPCAGGGLWNSISRKGIFKNVTASHLDDTTTTNTTY